MMRMILGCWVALAAVLVAAEEAAPLAFVAPFDESVHACQGAANPFVAAGNVALVPAGEGRGSCLRFGGHDDLPDGRSRLVGDKSAYIVDGVNVPQDRGTIGFWVRCGGRRHWSDGQDSWLLVLAPSVGECLIPTDDEGTGLALVKRADNTLALAEYQFHDRRITPSFIRMGTPYEVGTPDAVPVAVPVGGLSASSWVFVRLGWDRAAGRVWLGVGDDLREAAVSFRSAPWLCLLLGTPPSIGHASARGFDGEIDDLVIDGRLPTEAGAGRRPAAVPPVAVPVARPVPARHLADDPMGAALEAAVRQHLNLVVELQQVGGWAFSTAWPSRMSFLSTKVVIPYTRNFFNGSKDGNSTRSAQLLLLGHLALDEPAWLAAAERTAAALLRLQAPEGHWPYCARYRADRDEYEVLTGTDVAPLEDHVQSHPTLFLWLLAEVTGKAEYRAAADRGAAFILRSQNPRGSWSHHYNLKLQCGQAARREYLRAGEINDETTADQMQVMLLVYRRTGDPVYLQSFLRAADWLVSAFIDGAAKGWAQQYDEDNRPIKARHFEPDAVALSEGIHSAPQMLMLAYRITGDERYLEPCRKWRQWMLDQRVFLNPEKTRWGWHTYYDPVDGKPFLMTKGERQPPDDRLVSEGGFTAVLDAIEAVTTPEVFAAPTLAELQRRLEAAERAVASAADPVTARLQADSLLASFDSTAGSWLFNQAGSPTGPIVSASTGRVALLAWSAFQRRLARGQVPLDHRLATLSRVEFGSPFYVLMPPARYRAPLSAAEMAAARALPLPALPAPAAP